MKENALTVFTDGGCQGNPGPGGWAFIIMDKEVELAAKSGGESHTTNNRMELTAVIEAFRYILTAMPHKPLVLLHTDSQYVKNGIKLWIGNWKRNGWKTASKDPVKNQDLWMTLDNLSQQLDIQWHWVKGHAGNVLNERCDALVRKEISTILLGGKREAHR